MTGALDEKYFEAKSSNSTNNHLTTSPSAKRKRLEPSSLSEQEQIALAIGKCNTNQWICQLIEVKLFLLDKNRIVILLCVTAHSLRETSAAEDDNKSDSFGEPTSDESDFDFDDESSNQSIVKSQTSQTVSEKSNTFDNKLTEQECDSKVDEPVSTAVESSAVESSSVESSTVETYDSYLGNETGAFQLK